MKVSNSSWHRDGGGGTAAVPAMSLNAILAYERFEKQRIQQLGLNEKYSRYYIEKVCYPTTPRRQPPTIVRSDDRPTPRSRTVGQAGSDDLTTPRRLYNSVQPFATEGKKACGYSFAETMDNRRRDFGIDPADLPRWRNDPVDAAATRASTVQDQTLPASSSMPAVG